MKKVLLALLLGLAGALAPAAENGLPEKFDPRRDAAADVATAVALARAQGKRVLVDVGGEWCPWCHVLDRFFAARADVRQLRDDGFVWVKVSWSPQNRNEPLLSQWPKIKGYPHLFVLDDAGRLVHSQPTSAFEAGKDYDPERTIAFLKKYRRPDGGT